MQEPVQNQPYTAPAFYAPDPNQFQAPKKAGKKASSAIKVIALCLVCTLLGGAAGMGGAWLMHRSQTETAAPEADSTASHIFLGNREDVAISLEQVDTSRLLTAAEVYAQNVNSTVGITTSITTNYFGYRTTSAASGSGFIFSDDGYILTNFHVIEDANAITVTTYDGSSYDAALIGYDESNDLAVLKIEAAGLTPVVLGSSDRLNVGDGVVAIGNPLGELTFSLTTGVISALDREVTFSGNLTMDLIQTDCAINSGNSGGALFNMYGEVVGITNAKYSSSGTQASIDNIGFAIPMDDIYATVISIIEDGYIAKPYIGVSLADVSAETQAYGLPQGAAIRLVEDGSPAQQAGLKLNDIITKVNDTPITSAADLVDVVSGCAVGESLTLEVYRNGQHLTLQLTVGQKIQSALGQEAQSTPSQNSSGGNPWGFWGN